MISAYWAVIVRKPFRPLRPHSTFTKKLKVTVKILVISSRCLKHFSTSIENTNSKIKEFWQILRGLCLSILAEILETFMPRINYEKNFEVLTVVVEAIEPDN